MLAIVTQTLGNTFHSLQNRNFRLFWFGQCVSLIGTFMQRTAQYWLVYKITDSPFAVGMLGVCQFLPMLLFSLPVGTLIDRFPKRQILIATQLIFLAQAVILTLVTWAGVAQYWHILVLSAVYGLAQTVDMPVRHTFLYELVGKEDIMNAVSLNSTIVNGAKIFGPALAGMVMQQFGMTMCFGINAISFIAVIAGLLFIRTPRTAVRQTRPHIASEVKDGLRYIANSRVLVASIIIFAIVCTFALNHDVIAPVFAEKVLGRGADGYAGLLTAAGLGSLAGALLMASRSKQGIRGRILVIGGVGTALIQLATAFTANYAVSLALLAMVGFCNIVFLNTANALFQLGTPDEYRSRVMSIYSLLLMGSTPIGNFFVGTIMENVPGDSGFLSCGAVTLLLLVPVLIAKRHVIAEWFRREPHEDNEVNPLPPFPR